MNYLDEVEKELRHILDSDEPDAEKWAAEIVAFVREKLLESYKNGAQAARRGPGQTNTKKARPRNRALLPSPCFGPKRSGRGLKVD